MSVPTPSSSSSDITAAWKSATERGTRSSDRRPPLTVVTSSRWSTRSRSIWNDGPVGCGIGDVVKPRDVRYMVVFHQWLACGSLARRTLPTTCVYSWSVSRVPCQSAAGIAGHRSVCAVATASFLGTSVAEPGAGVLPRWRPTVAADRSAAPDGAGETARASVLAGQDVGLGPVPDRVVAGGLDVEPVVEDERAPDGPAEEREQGGGDAQHERGDGCRRLV